MSGWQSIYVGMRVRIDNYCNLERKVSAWVMMMDGLLLSLTKEVGYMAVDGLLIYVQGIKLFVEGVLVTVVAISLEFALRIGLLGAQVDSDLGFSWIGTQK